MNGYGTPREVVPMTEAELAAALQGELETAAARKPYHYPACSTGTCEGCDEQAGVDAASLLRAVGQ